MFSLILWIVCVFFKGLKLGTGAYLFLGCGVNMLLFWLDREGYLRYQGERDKSFFLLTGVKENWFWGLLMVLGDFTAWGWVFDYLIHRKDYV